ncbi:MAG: hypothetical protein GC206_13515, partial [Alphaproteobacteria bacterium]|nr:hypothetical protein [Alphaproteobacteria bacterium]
MGGIASIVTAAFAAVVSFFASPIGRVVGQLLTTAAIAAVARALQPKPKNVGGAELQRRAITALPREVVVGRAATAGSLVYEQTSGDDRKYWWQVVALSDNPCAGVHQISADGKVLTFDGDVTTGWRSCTSHFKNGSTPKLQVRVYLGAEDQTADATLMAAVPSEWTSAMRGRGICYAIERREYDEEAWTAGGGELLYTLNGATQIYDPRTDMTGFTRNAALIARQALRGFTLNGVRVVGLGAIEADVPDAAIEAAADECDEDVALAAGGTEKRYSADGVIDAGESAREYLADLVAAMGGQHIDRGGEIVILPGVARASVLAPITAADFLADEGQGYAGVRTGDELANAIASRFRDATQFYKEADLPRRFDSAAIADDGDRHEITRGYRLVTSKTQGQRLDQITLKEARRMGRLYCALPLWAIELEPGDWQDFDLPDWGGGVKTFRIETVELAISARGGDASARVRLTASEIAADVYEWDTADETDLDVAEIERAVPSLAISDFALAAVAASGASLASMPELEARWTAITDPAVDQVEIEYRVDGASQSYFGVVARAVTALRLRQGVYPSTPYEARARLRAGPRAGDWTDWEEVTTGPALRATGVVVGGTVAFDAGGTAIVAARAETQFVTDGAAIAWGPFDDTPKLTLDGAGLPALAEDDYYDLRIDEADAEGGTAYLKAVTGAGALSLQTGTSRTSVQTDPRIYEIEKPTSDDAYNGAYSFTVTGEITGVDESGGEPGAPVVVAGKIQWGIYYRTTHLGAWTLA